MLEEVSEDSQCFLLPEFDGRISAEQWVLTRWRFFLEQQLLEWVPNRRRWPRKLNRQVFSAWFRPEIHELLWDLVNPPTISSATEKTTIYEH